MCFYIHKKSSQIDCSFSIYKLATPLYPTLGACYMRFKAILHLFLSNKIYASYRYTNRSLAIIARLF